MNIQVYIYPATIYVYIHIYWEYIHSISEIIQLCCSSPSCKVLYSMRQLLEVFIFHCSRPYFSASLLPPPVRNLLDCFYSILWLVVLYSACPLIARTLFSLTIFFCFSCFMWNAVGRQIHQWGIRQFWETWNVMSRWCLYLLISYNSNSARFHNDRYKTSWSINL